jgi:hypothetical protein
VIGTGAEESQRVWQGRAEAGEGVATGHERASHILCVRPDVVESLPGCCCLASMRQAAQVYSRLHSGLHLMHSTFSYSRGPCPDSTISRHECFLERVCRIRQVRRAGEGTIKGRLCESGVGLSRLHVRIDWLTRANVDARSPCNAGHARARNYKKTEGATGDGQRSLHCRWGAELSLFASQRFPPISTSNGDDVLQRPKNGLALHCRPSVWRPTLPSTAAVELHCSPRLSNIAVLVLLHCTSAVARGKHPAFGMTAD